MTPSVVFRSLLVACAVLCVDARLRSKSLVQANLGVDAAATSTASVSAGLLASLSKTDAALSVEARAAQVAAQHVHHHVLQRDLAELLESFLASGCAAASHAKAPHCVRLLQLGSHLVQNQEPMGDTYSVYSSWINRTSEEVRKWKIDAAAPDSTDKVAVTVLLEGLQDPYMPHNVEYVVKSVIKRLGNQWALQIFYAADDQKEALAKALGNPKNVIWTKAYLQGQPVPPTKEAYNALRWSIDFFNQMNPKHEHVLIFELDSLLLRSHCVDQPNFLTYDIVGAAGCQHESEQCHAEFGQGLFPKGFMNGGFTMRKRSTMLQAIEQYPLEAAMGLDGGNYDEDSVVNAVFTQMGLLFAPEDQAAHFSMEQIAVEKPCAMHKPWIYSSITPEVMQSALDAADLVQQSAPQVMESSTPQPKDEGPPMNALSRKLSETANEDDEDEDDDEDVDGDDQDDNPGAMWQSAPHAAALVQESAPQVMQPPTPQLKDEGLPMNALSRKLPQLKL